MGYEDTVSSNTLGANSVLTVSTPSGVAFDATTQFQVFSGSLWFFNSGTVAVGFSVYDIATNAWTARSVTGIPTAWGDNGTVSLDNRTSRLFCCWDSYSRRSNYSYKFYKNLVY